MLVTAGAKELPWANIIGVWIGHELDLPAARHGEAAEHHHTQGVHPHVHHHPLDRSIRMTIRIRTAMKAIRSRLCYHPAELEDIDMTEILARTLLARFTTLWLV